MWGRAQASFYPPPPVSKHRQCPSTTPPVRCHLNTRYKRPPPGPLPQVGPRFLGWKAFFLVLHPQMHHMCLLHLKQNRCALAPPACFFNPLTCLLSQVQEREAPNGSSTENVPLYSILMVSKIIKTQLFLAHILHFQSEKRERHAAKIFQKSFIFRLRAFLGPKSG